MLHRSLGNLYIYIYIYGHLGNEDYEDPFLPYVGRDKACGHAL